MKKLLALMAIAAIAFVSCKKDDDNSSSNGGGSNAGLVVEKKNRALLLDFSETWCPPCGSYGGPSFDSCMSLEGDNLTLMKVYGSSTPSGLNSSISNGMASAYGVSGVPDFWVNGYELAPGGGVYSSIASNFNWVKGKATAFAADSVIAGVAMAKTIVGDSMKIVSRVKFFKEQPAGVDYRLALYVVEEGIIANQQTSSGAVSNYEHNNLVRKSTGSTYSGVALNSSAPIVADQLFDSTYTVALNPAWDYDNLKVVGVIWKGGSTPFKVVNSNVLK